MKLTLSILGKGGDGEDEGGEDAEPRSLRVYHRFKRVTETFTMLDGTEVTITYDDAVVNRRSVDVDEDGLYRVKETNTPKGSSQPDLNVRMDKVGSLHRENVPVSTIDESVNMVAYAEVTKNSEKGWSYQFESPVRLCTDEEFNRKPEDKAVHIRRTEKRRLADQ